MHPDDTHPQGAPRAEVKPSMKRRSPWHDYYQPGIYMLTLALSDRRPLLGTLVGTPDAARVQLSPLGQRILHQELPKISHYYPMVEVWKACLMPDHIHLILQVKVPLPQGKHLGHIVRGFKTGCTRAWWALQDAAPSAPPAPSAAPSAPPAPSAPQPAAVLSVSPERTRPLLFEPGYNDKILQRPGQLANRKRYLDDNARRLLLKRLHPDLFTVLHGMDVAGRPCQVVGNRFLLDVPDKAAVIIHRRYTPEECERLRQQWLAFGEAGGVLVSAAIAPKEKAILHEAMDRGFRIILLRENGFPELYKPSGRAFDACVEGRLLQVSPWPHHNERRVITRQQCLELNALAERLAHPW